MMIHRKAERADSGSRSGRRKKPSATRATMLGENSQKYPPDFSSLRQGHDSAPADQTPYKARSKLSPRQAKQNSENVTPLLSLSDNTNGQTDHRF